MGSDAAGTSQSRRVTELGGPLGKLGGHKWELGGLGVFGKVEIFDCSEFQNIVTYDCCKFFCSSFSS